jgi:AcrR family transcriptional regulator
MAARAKAKKGSRAEPARRPGGRSARVRADVMKATLAELAEAGYGSLSLDGVATRAGVHKTTIYRRWGSRESLVLDALLERGRETVPIPDTGSLRADLFTYGREIAESLKDPGVDGTVRAIASIGDDDSPLAQTSRRFWEERFRLAGAMVERAIERGEVPPETDPRVVVEAMVAAIYFRLLLSREKLDRRFLRGIAELAASQPKGGDAEAPPPVR